MHTDVLSNDGLYTLRIYDIGSTGSRPSCLTRIKEMRDGITNQ